jgi:hypothetical protein
MAIAFQIVAVRFPAFDSGVHRLGVRAATRHDPAMDTDILIAGLMTLGSVLLLAGLITLVARATSETPRPKVEPAEPTPALRPAPGW